MPCEGSGFCKLQAAGLTPEERRVILSSTRGSLEFGQVTKALQTLWDEQFAGQCAQVHHSNFQETYAAEIDETDSWQREDAQYAEDWSSWHDPYWDWSEKYVAEQLEEPSSAFARDPAIKEAQQAERVSQLL